MSTIRLVLTPDIERYLEFARRRTRGYQMAARSDEIYLRVALEEGLRADAEYQRHRMIADAQPFNEGSAV